MPATKKPRTAPAFNTMGDDDEDKPKAAEKPKKKTAAELAAEAGDDYDVDDEKPPKKKAGKEPKAEKVKIVTEVDPSVTVALADGRNLTKKDQDKLKVWRTKDRTKLLDTFFTRQRDEARKKFGHQSVFIGSESEALVIGIPCPSLAFEYVIGQDCFPLGLVAQIVAKHGVGKSGLLAEFGRWFDKAGGGMVLMENETKFNPYWYASIMGETVYNRMQLHRCTSVEDWQKHLTFAIKMMQTDMMGVKDAPGPGKTFPVLYGVDSIMGKMSEENQEKILGAKSKKKGKEVTRGTTGEGYAQARSFPIEAGSITKYMRTIPQEMDGWPFALVLINHLRIKQDDMGNKERNKTGGEQVNFQESFELELAKVGGHAKKISCADYEGIPLQISCEKNSFGPTGRKTQTRVLWWHEQDEKSGESVQKTVWDWDWSTVWLLNQLRNGEHTSTYTKNKLKQMGFHIDCPSAGDTENAAWSDTLGMKKTDAVPWNELGAMFREDKKLLRQIREAIGIVRRPRLKGDYTEQITKLSEAMP
jgi:hypothetical protein